MSGARNWPPGRELMRWQDEQHAAAPNARYLVLLLLAAAAVGLGAQEGRARIALFGLEAGASAARILPVTDAVADTMALTLALLGRFEVVRLETADALADTAALREYCAANRIDQAIGGSGTPRTGGGFTFRLGVYDRHKDRVTLVREGSSSGLLDVFEVTDELVTGLLEALSGTHIGFGSLKLERRGEQGEYSVLIDGTPIGTDVAEVERLLLGRRTVSVTAAAAASGGGDRHLGGAGARGRTGLGVLRDTWDHGGGAAGAGSADGNSEGWVERAGSGEGGGGGA